MKLFKIILITLYREMYLIKVAFLRNIFGIEYVSQKLSQCPKLVIPHLLRRNGAIIGNNVNFKDSICIDNASGDEDALGDFSNIKIGDKSYIGKGVFFDLPDQVIIEKECAISAGVKFITHSDCGNRIMSTWYPRKKGKIVIGFGSWIGVNAIILSGVKLGKCCVVGAGAIVTKSFPEYSVVAGAPAKVIKTLSIINEDKNKS